MVITIRQDRYCLWEVGGGGEIVNVADWQVGKPANPFTMAQLERNNIHGYHHMTRQVLFVGGG